MPSCITKSLNTAHRVNHAQNLTEPQKLLFVRLAVIKDSMNKIHLAIALLINILVVSKLIHFSWVGNDKAILVVGFYYFILILLNMMSWLILDYFKRKAARIYKISTVGLIILIIPILVVSMLH